MIRALYAAASGMIAGLARQMIITHNLANTATVGYKALRLPQEAGGDAALVRRTGESLFPAGPLGTGALTQELLIDWAQGPLEWTGRSLDVALRGPGLLRVATPEGERYTRDGSLRLDGQGRLVTAAGLPVLGAGGAIVVGPGEVTIAPDGTVSVDGEAAGHIGLVEFADPGLLQRLDGNLYAAGEAGAPQAAPDTQLRQGYLERANVDAAATMVEMLQVARAYEASQQAVRIQDELMRSSLDVGQV